MLFGSRPAARMHALVSAYAELGRFSGTVLVARAGRVLFNRAYGMANHEHAVPNTVDTAFRIGSQTKTFTAIAVLRAQEDGLLTLDDPLTAHLAGYPGGDRITIHHLLTNTSGIPDYVTTEEFTSVMGLPRSPDELIASFRERPPLFAPGLRMSYSNSGWVLLGAILERLSGRSFGEYLRERVLDPLDMRDSGLGRAGDVLAHHADGYVSADGRVTRAAWVDNSNQYAAGAMHSTAPDLHRWWTGLREGGLLRPDSLRLLFTPHVRTEAGAYGYGCLLGTAFGRERIETSGGTIGYVSTSTSYPREDLFVAVLSNFENSAYTEVEHGMAAIALGEPHRPPERRTFVTVDPDVFERYLGGYTMRYMGRSSTMRVTREGDRLMAEVHGLNRAELRPLSPTRYLAQMKGEVELNFTVGDDGAPAREIAMIWAGHPVTARRVEE